jgi:hypothetical protein
MSWYIRKSFNIGPLRFNLSKSGIGTSVGTKGFRLGKKPNGKQYVHAGRCGLYFRQNLDSDKDRNCKSLKPTPQLYNKSGNGSGCLSIFVCLAILTVILSCIF